MKLRNKKTGEIVRVEFLNNWETDDGTEIGFRVANTLDVYSYISLAKLNEEWEDMSEEPKKHWCITMYGGITRIKDDEEPIDDLKEIGNYFNDKESAYDALDKLKAWKRLKDKGFRFTGINDDEDSQELINQCGILCETKADIYHLAKDEDFLLLFGGEE